MGIFRAKLKPGDETKERCSNEQVNNLSDISKVRLLDQCTIMNSSPTKLAVRLKYFLTHWERLTSDPDILEFVKGVKIEFHNDEVPNQTVCRTCNFNKQEQAIVELEI